MKSVWLDLVTASARLRVPWHTAHRWVLIGRLQGERRGNRWFVAERSVRKVELDRQGAKPEPASVTHR
jgi:predicted site-specific integrase-resolvase